VPPQLNAFSEEPDDMPASAVAALSDRFVVVQGTSRPCELAGGAATIGATHAAVLRGDDFLGLVRLANLANGADERPFEDLLDEHSGPVVTEGTALPEIGRLLVAHHAHALPVVAADGSFRGIVTPHSYLAALLVTGISATGSTGGRAPGRDGTDLLAQQRADELRRANRILQAEMSERVRAESALRRSETLLRSVVDNVPAIIARLQLDGTFAFVNRTIPGWSPDEVVGRHVTDFVPPGRRPEMAEILVRAIATGQTQSCEFPGFCPRGTTGIYSWRVAPVREGREVVGLITVATDVSEANAAKAQVRYYTEIVENIEIGLYVYRMETHPEGATLRCLSANPASTRLTGISAADFLDRTIDEVFPNMRKTEIQKIAIKVLQSGTPVHVDEFWYGDARIPFSAWSFTVFPLVEHCVGIAFENITDRMHAADALRASEELNRLILQSVPAGIVQIDRDGRIVSANSQAQKFLGLPEEIPPDCTFHGLRLETGREDGSYGPPRENPVAQCLATNLPQPPVTIGVRQHDGGLRWAVFSAIPLPDHEIGDCRGAVLTFLDITDRKHTEEQSHELQSELAHVARLSTMGEMASGLAHELNQPLAAIIAYADACQELVESGRIEQGQLLDVLRAVASQADRAGKIIHRLRNLVKKSHPVRTSIQVNDAVREVVALLETEIRHAGAEVHLELDSAVPAITGDFIQIQQVILNLMRNGLDAMTEAGLSRPALAVSSRITDDHRIEIAIRDFGRGIAEENLGRLFEPFFTTKSEGLGMGLPISRTIIEAHGGRLWLTSNEDPGSGDTGSGTAGMTARIVLPIVDGRVLHDSGTDGLHR
jgi:PAS domain S-box-containing protein